MAADLATASGRIRYAAGDVDDTNVLMPPFGAAGIAVYATLLTQHSNDEALAWGAACGALYAYYATLPTAIGDAGASLAWAGRLDAWRDGANGVIRYPFALVGVDPAPPAAPALAAFVTIPGRRGA